MKKLVLSLLIPVCFVSNANAFDYKFAGGIAAGVASALSIGAGVKFMRDNRDEPPPKLAPLFAFPLFLGGVTSAAVSALLITDPNLHLENCSTITRVAALTGKLAVGAAAGSISALSGALGAYLAKQGVPCNQYQWMFLGGFASTAVSMGVLSAMALNSALDVNVGLKY